MRKVPDMKMKFPMTKDLKRWFRSIGSKGGQAGKGTKKRSDLMRENAHKRWAKQREREAQEEAEDKKLMASVGVPEVAPEIGFK
jgi:hypothetical protein